PKPAVSPVPPVNQDAAQLSIPQTSVRLPPPQPVNPAALAKVPDAAPPPEEPAQPQSNPKPRRTAPAAAVAAIPPKTESVLTAPLPAAPPPAAAATEERPRFQALLPPEEQRRIEQAIESRTREVNERLKQAERRRLSQQEENIVSKIKSF